MATIKDIAKWQVFQLLQFLELLMVRVKQKRND